MKKQVECFELCLLLCVTIVFGVSATNAQTFDYKSVVKGRVVDTKGAPMPNAGVMLEVIANVDDVGDRGKFSVATDQDGRFRVENSSTISSRIRFLWVTAARPRKGMYTIDIPSVSLENTDPKFNGVPLTLDGNEEIEIGDIQAQVWFGYVELFIFDEMGKPYLIAEGDWGKRCFGAIRNENGKFIAGISLSTEDLRNWIDLKKGSVKIELPEGIWQIEMVSDIGNLDSVIGTSKKFEIKKDEFKKVVIVISK